MRHLIFNCSFLIINSLREGYGVGPFFRGRPCVLGSPASSDDYLLIIILYCLNKLACSTRSINLLDIFITVSLQKGGVPAAPSGTATLLRLSPNYQCYPRALLAVTHFRYSRLSWLDGRCVQGPGTYSPRRG